MKYRFSLLIIGMVFQTTIAQESLQEYINIIPKYDSYDSSFSYYDSIKHENTQKVEISNSILKKLNIRTLHHKSYYFTGKYTINNLLILFVLTYSDYEQAHSAILFNNKLEIIDTLSETAYDNAEGFYGARTYIAYNILSTTTQNIYETPEYQTKHYSITKNGFQPIVENIVVNTPSGLRLRKEDTTQSAVVTAIPQGEKLKYVSNKGYVLDSIYDDGRYKKGYWIKVATRTEPARIGYLFDAFTKREYLVTTDDYQITIGSISDSAFAKAKQNATPNISYKSIESTNKIKDLLKGKLFYKKDENDDYYFLDKIVADNGKVIQNEEDNNHLFDCGIAYYYPELHYLVLECGHSSDYVIWLKNGDDQTDKLGNPEYWIPSPNHTFRLNGYYSGHAGMYFIEKHTNGKIEYLLSLNDLLNIDYMQQGFWTNDNILYFNIEQSYYQLVINDL